MEGQTSGWDRIWYRWVVGTWVGEDRCVGWIDRLLDRLIDLQADKRMGA